MQVNVDIAFEQLGQMAKELPAEQWNKLKEEVESKISVRKRRSDFKKLLLNGPVFSEDQLKEVAATRKAINRWRTKL